MFRVAEFDQLMDAFVSDDLEYFAELSREARSTATMALQVMPFGTRALLRAADLVTQTDDGWQFTETGWDFLPFCVAFDREDRTVANSQREEKALAES